VGGIGVEMAAIAGAAVSIGLGVFGGVFVSVGCPAVSPIIGIGCASGDGRQAIRNGSKNKI
jgi:hypothetical protein